MQDIPDISYPQLFFAYAQENPRRWKVVVGQQITHTKFGIGTINSADGAYLVVCFVNDQKTSRMFTSESFAKAQLFINLQLPTNLEGIEATKERLQAKLYQEVQKRLETEKRIAEERLEGQRLEGQREKEQVAAHEFLNLKTKYLARSHRMSSPSSPLYLILLRIDSGEVLQDDQMAWLEDNRLSDTLAIYFQNEYQKTKDPWKLIKASGHLRDVNNPSKAIELTNYLLENHSSASPKVKSAILTTRGGAFRDLQDLSAAEVCAKDAIKQNESFQPYNLLGAIYFERGKPEQGEAYFLRALELGAQSKVQETQMQSALKNAGQSEKGIIAQFLLQRDPAKYQWATYYLEQKNRVSTNE